VFSQSVIPQLVERRKSLGIAQADLDLEIGVANGLVAKWEVGMRKPSGFLLHCWAQALGCELALKPRS